MQRLVHHKFLGFLDSGHYNSLGLEKCHYNSSWTSPIIITILLHLCYFLRLQGIKAHCQAYILQNACGSVPVSSARLTHPWTPRRTCVAVPWTSALGASRHAPMPCRCRLPWGWLTRRRGRRRGSATDTTSTIPAPAAHVRGALRGVGRLVYNNRSI